MGFADAYIQKHALYGNLIEKEPDENLSIIVVVPCYRENNVFPLLHSLQVAYSFFRDIEVIILVNASENDGREVLLLNDTTIHEIREWTLSNTLPIQLIQLNNLPGKHAGAGLARKIAMDEAIARFNMIGKPAGIIASLDADCSVSSNYFKELIHVFEEKRANACSLYFEHPISDNPEGKAIVLYELYLRYFVQAMKYCNLPYAFHTIGSCFAVRADVYCKQGGMNRRQAGEDFYFLHKIIPLGAFYEVNAAIVYPSARLSDRVPFGTGPALKKIIEQNYSFYTYKMDAFESVKQLKQLLPLFFKKEENRMLKTFSQLQGELRNFLIKNLFFEKIKEINNNTASEEAFINRFFSWFDAFMLVKYMNFYHEEKKSLSDVRKEASNLLSVLGDITIPDESVSLLNLFRAMQRKG